MTARWVWLGGLALPVSMGMVACGPTIGEIANADDGDDDESSSDDGDDDDDDDDSTVSLTTDSPSTTEPTPDPSDSTGEVPTSCGDAIVDDGEECDDANGDASDGCEADCRFSPGTLLWSRSIDGGPHIADFGAAVAVDGDGTIHAVGSMMRGSDYDAWYGMFDPDGELIREAGFDQFGDEYGHSVVVDASGTAYVGARNDDLAFVLRVIPDGIEIVGEPLTHDLPFAVLAAATPSGGFATLRQVNELDGADAFGYVIEGYDGGDAPTWSAQDIPDALFAAMAPTPEGGFVIAGHTRGEDNHDHIYVRELASDGAVVWTYADDMPDYEDEGAQTVVVTSDGRVRVAGQREIPGFGYVPYLADFDREGALLGIEELSIGDASFSPYALVEDGDGLVLGGVAYPDQTPSDAVVAAIDGTGVVRWGMSYDDALGFNDSVRAMVRDGATGDLIVVGTDVAEGESDNLWLARVRG